MSSRCVELAGSIFHGVIRPGSRALCRDRAAISYQRGTVVWQAEASEAGWYDIWLAVHAELCGDYQAYGGSDNGGEQAEPLSDSKLRSISEHKVVTLANKWMNETNFSLPSGSKIINTRILSAMASVQSSGSVAIVTTEVEYWISGGSPDGSVYATVTIDRYTGDVLSASIG